MNWVKAGWSLISNPAIDFGDDEPTRVSRRERFEMLRPMWTYTLFVKEAACGCSWRFGWKRWQTMWCSKHVIDEIRPTLEEKT